MNENKYIEVGGRLHSIATGNILLGANEVFDDDKNKKQNDINTETYSLVNNINERLNSLSPDQQSALNVATKATNNETKLGYYVCDTENNVAAKVISNATGYILSNGGSIKIKMTNANTANDATLNINSTGPKPLYYDGERVSANNSWMAGETVEVYYDGTSYYANNVAGGSSDGVFDVSRKYPTSGIEGGNTYTLEGALSVLNTRLSSNKKKGGMSIKFVQSSDNKYVQYRLMSDNFSTSVSDWQGVDAEPITVSKNLVESGGVAGKIGKVSSKTVAIEVRTYSGFDNSKQKCPILEGDRFTVEVINVSVTLAINPVQSIAVAYVDGTRETIESNIKLSDYPKTYTAAKDIEYVAFLMDGYATAAGDMEFNVYSGVYNKIKETIKKIDNAPIEDSTNLVSSGGVYNAITDLSEEAYAAITDVKKELVFSKFVGNGNTFVYSDVIYRLKPNYKYRVVVSTKYTYTDIQGAYLFVIDSYDENDNPTTIGGTLAPATVNDYYDITIPSNSKYIKVGGRASLGTEVYFYIEELTVIEEKINNTGEIHKQVAVTAGTFSPNANSVVSINVSQGKTLSLIIRRGTAIINIESRPDYKASLKFVYNNSGTYTTIENISFDKVHKYVAPDNITAVSFTIEGLYIAGSGTLEFEVYSGVNEEIFENKERIIVLENDKEYNSGIFKFNRDEDFRDKFNQIVCVDAQNNVRPLIIAQYSDIHDRMQLNLPRIIAFCNRYASYIDEYLNTGDSVQQYYTDPFPAESISGAGKFINIIGNHDTASNNGGSIDWTEYVGAPAYNKFIAPFISQWGVVHDGNTSHCYFYKDYQSKNIRMICLDVMGYDSTQDTWFADVLASAKTSGYEVVVAAHCIGEQIDGFDCNYSSIERTIRNWNEYNPYMSNAITTLQTWINGGGSFVCWITGHLHKDLIGKVHGTNQLVLSVDTALCKDIPQSGIINIDGSDSAHIIDTKSQDGFCIIGIDTQNKMVKVFKVGTDKDKWMRQKSSICIDYENVTIISEH